MKILKALLLILLFLSLVALALRFGLEPLKQVLGLQERAGLSIESNPPAEVIIDGKSFGTTPVSVDQLVPGQGTVELRAMMEGKEASWVGKVPLNSGVVTVVNRELSENQATASGEVISLDHGDGVLIMSSPSEATVTVDGVETGRTPIELKINPGAHVFAVGRSGYLTRSIQANSVAGRKLVVSVDLSLDQADLTKLETQPLMDSRQVEVLPTPTGYLRVRKGPGIGYAEVGRVDSGEKLLLLEETGGWYKIRTIQGVDGYISSNYAKKL